jgi:hypothetical protein
MSAKPLGRRGTTMKMTSAWLVLMALTAIRPGLVVSAWSGTQNPTASPGSLTRQYREGERLVYRMTASNRDRVRTTVYGATARGVVKRDPAGTFYEEYEWSDIIWNGVPFDLPESNRAFRQLLSLAPNYTPALPDFSKLHPRLVGPTADLMTFYSDVWLAIRQPALRQGGDQVRVDHGDASSWADGTRIVLGEDSIDFNIALGEASTATGTRELTVRHVPPKQPKIRIPADWMRVPVADVPNNWVQVTKLAEGRYIASVGKETFDAQIRLSVANGRIMSAVLENPVEVFERECKDDALTQCGEGVRYRILRQIQIVEIP